MIERKTVASDEASYSNDEAAVKNWLRHTGCQQSQAQPKPIFLVAMRIAPPRTSLRLFHDVLNAPSLD